MLALARRWARPATPVLHGSPRRSRLVRVFRDGLPVAGFRFAEWQLREALQVARALHFCDPDEPVYAVGRPGEEALWWIECSFSGGTTENFTATATWTCPSIGVNGFQVTSVNVECWATGGNGGATSGIGGTSPGAGGGGGAYSKKLAITVTPTTGYTATVPATGSAGDAWFSTTGTVLAKAGANAVTTTPGVGGAAASGVGDTKFSGGNGAAGSGVTGGGGGGGAGDATTGNNAVGGTGGGGAAAEGGAGGVQNTNGNLHGGGGGGAAAVTGTAGQGFRGEVRINYLRQFSRTTTETAGAIDEGTNIITGDDADFEGGIGSWLTTASDWALTSSTTQANTGTHSLRLEANSAGLNGGVFPTTSEVVVAGTVYVCYFFARANSQIRFIQGQIVWYSDTGATTIISIASGPLLQDSSSAWVKMGVAGEAPPGAVRARLLITYSNRAINELHFIDTVSMQTSGYDRVFVGARSTAESVAAPTDAVARTYAARRTMTESTSAPTDAVSRLFVGARTMAEAVAAPTDVVTRQLVQARTISEAVAAPTDAVSRLLVLARAISESVAAPTDAVVRAFVGARTIGESTAAPTDVVTRHLVMARAIAESITAPTDVVTRVLAQGRLIAESITAPTDTVARAQVLARTIQETFYSTKGVAVGLDGVDDIILIPDNAAYNFTAMTFECWFYARKVDARQFLVYKGTAVFPVWAVYLDLTAIGGGPAVSNFRSGGGYAVASTDLVFTTGEWQHFAFSWDGSFVRMYRNGIAATTLPYAFSGPLDTTTDPLGLGGPFDSSFYRGAFMLDDVRLWNVARSQAQILASMNTELVGNETGLVGYWKMNDVGPTTAVDFSPTTNNGTQSGGVAFGVEGVLPTPVLGSVSDSVSRRVVAARTIAEAIGAPTDTITRILQAARSIAESIGAPTDIITRTAAFNRSIAESIGAPTDLVARVLEQYRTINENIAAPLDTITRHADFFRTISEVLPGEAIPGSTKKVLVAAFDD